MPARFATFSSVVRSNPRSRMSARAASSNAARVRSRLYPFGLPRGDDAFSLAIGLKIVHLFYTFNTKRAVYEEKADDGKHSNRGRDPARRRGRRTGRGGGARVARRRGPAVRDRRPARLGVRAASRA